MSKLALLLLALSLLACGGAKQTGSTTPEQTASASTKDCAESCPMHVQGTQISYEDAPDGAAMVFTTESGEVADLQARVAQMAERHNQPGPKGMPGHVAHSARADNVERGARLVMTAADPNEVEALRAHVREHVEKVQAGECPMMSDHGPGEGHGHGPGHGPGHGHGHGQGGPGAGGNQS